MDMIKVDPKLFVTCRLCLNDIGLYQIVPTVQQQIKYCFDINIEPFDGLPQLICNKCREILSNYHMTKKTFSENQQTLKTKLEEKKDDTTQSQQECEMSCKKSESDDENIKENNLFKARKRKTAFIFSSTSSENEDHNVSADVNKNNNLNESNILSSSTNQSSWKTGFNKKIECRLCRRYFKTKSLLNKHIRSHDNLLQKYPKIYRMNCTVVLKKIDDKPNFTNMKNAVVFNEDKVIQNEGSIYYHVTYSRKDANSGSNQTYLYNSKTTSKQSKEIYVDSDSSNNDIITKRKKRKNRRLMSRSSNETVILERNNKSPGIHESECSSKINIQVESKKENTTKKNIECINIDDTSTDSIGGYKNNTVSQIDSNDNIGAQVTDYKTIQNIISMCCNKQQKKISTSDNGSNYNLKHQANLRALLKHKVLSIGRKVINKQGINCTGILRFLESANLDIIWIPTILSSKETNCVRIMTKLKTVDENDQFSGWKSLQEMDEENNGLEKNAPHELNEYLLETNANEMNSDQVHIPSEVITKRPSKTLPEQNKLHTIKVNGGIMFTNNNSTNADTDTILKNRLLNASPVANPKKLPKKSNTEIKLGVKIGDSIALQNIPTEETNTESISIDLDDDVCDNNTMCMPVITSTTSLASTLTEIKDKEKQNDVDNSSRLNDVAPVDVNKVICSEKIGPRIKVKPVSELMPERVSNNVSQQQPYASSNIWTYSEVPYQNIVTPVYVNNMMPQNVSQTNSNFQMVPNPNYNTGESTHMEQSQNTMSSVPQTSTREYIILDTVELPNTKTNSPFQYFVNLLQIHGIILLDPEESLPPEFVCLIKFKVLFNQEGINITFCLSLFCSKNKFCFKVKYINQMNIDIKKMSANWQWEILKTFRGDTITKILQNAQKHSQDVYAYTNRFLCLLKSINFVTDS